MAFCHFARLKFALDRAHRPAGTPVAPDQPTVLLSYVSDTNLNWTYVDCYSDLVPGRALPNGLSNSAQTVEGCLDACNARGYAYCGVEYHGGQSSIYLVRVVARLGG